MPLFISLIVFIAIAVGLAWYFIGHDRGEREPVWALWVAAGMGVVGAGAAGIIEAHFIPAKGLAPGAPLLTLFISTLLVGVIEEGCKFIPLSLYLYPKRYFNEHTDGIIYFAIAGMGFGLLENILYTLQFGAGIGLARIILTPVFHAATTGIVGYFLIKGKLAHRSRWTAWLTLGMAMIAHGLYDFGLLSALPAFVLMSILITTTVSVGLFVIYSRATNEDQEAGLSVVGHNAFCRSCGTPNPRGGLYCTHCGNHA